MSVSRFERMVAVPEEEYQYLKSLQHVKNDPLENKFLSLSNDYHRQGLISDLQTRVQRQGETLNEMIKIKDDLGKRVIDATPKPYQKRAQSLLNYLRQKLDVNQKGELMDKFGKAIEGSHIGDLIQHAVRDRRRNIIPIGWEQFLSTLQDENAPRMILNYDTLDEMRHPKNFQAAPKVGKQLKFGSPIPFNANVKTEGVTPVSEKKRKLSSVSPNPFSIPKQEVKSKKSKRVKKKPTNLKDYITPLKYGKFSKYV